MTEADRVARRRWLALVGMRLAAVAGAVLGLILIARAHDLAPKVLGTAIVLSALLMMGTVPPALARRWRTPPE